MPTEFPVGIFLRLNRPKLLMTTYRVFPFYNRIGFLSVPQAEPGA